MLHGQAFLFQPLMGLLQLLINSGFFWLQVLEYISTTRIFRLFDA